MLEYTGEYTEECLGARAAFGTSDGVRSD